MSKHNQRKYKKPERKFVANVPPQEDHVALATAPETAKAEEGVKPEVNWRLRHDLLAGEVVRLEKELAFARGANQQLVKEKNEIMQQAAQQAQVMQGQLQDLNKQQQELATEITALRKKLQDLEAKDDGNID